MQDEIRKGTIAVTDHGDLVFITRTNVTSDEPDAQGRIWTFQVGSVLRSNSLPVGSRYAGTALRSVCQIEDALRLLAKCYDITTPAERPESELSETEQLKRKVERLEKLLLEQKSDVAARPRTGIEALQPQK